MLTVSNALLMSTATAGVRSGGLFLVKACCDGVLYVVLVKWLLLNPCWVEMCGILFLMYGSSIVSSVFAINEGSEMALYNVLVFVRF